MKKMKASLWLVLLLACAELGGCIFQKSHLPDEGTPGAWLREHAVPFETADPEKPYQDLMPLKEIIGDARIVALGEATHGTSEFFTMKHKILKFLVKEMDFNVFAIEAIWPQSMLINQYVHTGEGDPEELLAGLYFWTWNTEEVLNMITWMQEHNQNPGNDPQVSFYGFDMQGPSMAMDNVISFLQEVDPRAADDVRILYAPFRSVMDEPQERLKYSQEKQSTIDECKENVEKVYNVLKSHQGAYEILSSSEEFAFALQSARICVQAEDLYSGRKTYQLRDQYMAENVAWILDQTGPTSKIVLWAHNAHVGTGYPGFKSMGTHLREKYGDEMVVCGFSFYEGSFNAHTMTGPDQLKKYQVEKPPEDSYEHYFHTAALPRFFLDLRDIQSIPVTDWLRELHFFRSIGSAYDESHPEDFFSEIVLPEMFDVIIYFETTTPSHLIPLYFFYLEDILIILPNRQW